MVRKAGFAVLALGMLLVAWVGVTVWWGDPITSLYTRYEQHALARELDSQTAQWPAAPLALSSRLRVSTLLATRAAVADRSLRDGEPIGRIVIPRLHLNMVFVEGTTESDLRLGPGHYNAASGEQTAIPGMGGVVGIAGHRTTYLHPFRHIDDLRAGDNIYLKTSYGVFRYAVFAHRIVASNDWRILRGKPFEQLVLSACHPLYSATHRWVVFARLRGEGLPAGAAGADRGRANTQSAGLRS